MAQANAGTAGLLSRQLKAMQIAKDLPGISCGLVNDNVFEWEVMVCSICLLAWRMSPKPSINSWLFTCKEDPRLSRYTHQKSMLT